MPTDTRPFHSARLKLARAAEHIESLEVVINAYFASEWCTSVLSKDVDGKYHLSTTMHGEPHNYRLIVGDAIHNMRAALDLMAVELVTLNGKSGKGVCFPFSADAASLDGAIKSKNFQKASSAAIALLKATKPYYGGNDLLRALHDLDIQDKHHRIEPSYCMLSTPPLSVVRDDMGRPAGFDTGELRLEIDESQSPKAIMTFPGNGPLGNKPVLDELRAMHALVTNIVNDFEAICP